jgi:hypothetical protein
MNEIRVPISPGELLDKITILRIKAARMTNLNQLAHVRTELDALETTWKNSAYARFDVESDLTALQAVNERLWAIEDDIRDKERAQAFDADFIRLARSVYIANDERASIKRRLNVNLGSALVEEKSYRDYQARDEQTRDNQPPV